MSDLIRLLSSKGAEFNQEETQITSSSRQATQMIPLIHQRVLSILGPDTEKFLQGQVTCDMREVFARGSALGAHCNIKGHMLSLFRIMRISNEQVWLRMHHSTFTSAEANLKKYIIFSKAETADISAETAGVGIKGPGAQAYIENTFGACPSEDNGVLSLKNGVVVRVPGNRYEIWMDAPALAELIDKLPDEVGIGATDDWLLSEIDAALPDVTAPTQEAFIPQMTNMQAVGGVSFTKGCYTGQEIITRLQHRGVLKKPMYIGEVTADSLPQPGQTVYSEQASGVGKVVFAAPVAEDRYRLLAVINKTAVDSAAVNLGDNNTAIDILPLPYELDAKLFERK